MVFNVFVNIMCIAEGFGYTVVQFKFWSFTIFLFSHLTSFKHLGSSTCSNVHVQSLDTCGQHKARDWTEHVEDQKRLKFIRYFWFYSSSKKNSICFGSCSELLQLEFVQPPRKLHGKWKMSHIYNFVEQLHCEFSCIACVRVDQS